MIRRFLNNSKSNGSLYKAISLSLIMRVLSAFSGLIVSVFISRELGANEAGLYFLAYSIVFFLASLFRIGLDDTIVKFTGKVYGSAEEGSLKSVLYKAISISIAPTILITLLLFLFSNEISKYIFEKPNFSPVLRNIAFACIFLSLSVFISKSLQGCKKIISSIYILNVSNSILLILMITMLGKLNAAELSFYFLICTIITFTTSVILWLFYNRKISYIDLPIEEIYKSCLPLWIVVIMGQFVQWSSQIISGFYLQPDDISLLATAQRMATSTSFVLLAVNMVVAPRFAKLYAGNNINKLEKLAKNSIRIMLLISIPITTFILLVPELIMSIFGPEFTRGATVLQIICLGQVINVLAGSVGLLLSMSGHERDLRTVTLISGPIALVLPFILIPTYGINGAAYSTAISMITQNLIAAFLVKRRLGFNTLIFWKMETEK